MSCFGWIYLENTEKFTDYIVALFPFLFIYASAALLHEVLHCRMMIHFSIVLLCLRTSKNNLYPDYFIRLINTLMLFWPILGQRKTSLVVFLWKRSTSSVVFLSTNIISNGIYKAIKNNIGDKKTTELFLIFHKKTTNLVFF